MTCLVRRDFMNTEIFNKLDTDLKEKVRQKLEKVKHLGTSTATCFIHGSFTRSKIFFNENITDTPIKLIDFETVNLGSPVVDVGRILLTNMPNETNVSMLEKFCRDMVHYYITNVNKEYPMVDNTLEHDIINHLLFPYVNLTAKEFEEITNHIPILHALNNLGSFN